MDLGNWYLVNGRCSKHYAKSYLEEIRMDEDAYPYYRRRNNDKSFEDSGGYIVDNRYVVVLFYRLFLIVI